jgi:hypothetical protein
MDARTAGLPEEAGFGSAGKPPDRLIHDSY